jgi:ADP-ribose pyrophosphatase YjhB (NUDIX family)
MMNAVPFVDLAICQDENILLVRYADKPDEWQLPKERVLRFEAPADAAFRLCEDQFNIRPHELF